MCTMKRLFRDVSYSKGIRRQLWSTLSCHYAEKELYKEWKKFTLVCFAASNSGITVFEIYTKITLYRHWYTEFDEKLWLQTKKKEDKSKPIWSSSTSCCRLLIFFSFLVVQNVFPSYWNGRYVCTHHREMIKETFLFVWLKSKALLFLCALLLARSGNRQQNRCILCAASLKPTAAGQTDMLYYLWRKTKLLKISGQISKKNPVVPWSFHCFFSIFLLFEVHL